MSGSTRSASSSTRSSASREVAVTARTVRPRCDQAVHHERPDRSGTGQVEGGLHRRVGQRAGERGRGDEALGDGEERRGRHRGSLLGARRKTPVVTGRGEFEKSTGVVGLSHASRGSTTTTTGARAPVCPDFISRGTTGNMRITRLVAGSVTAGLLGLTPIAIAAPSQAADNWTTPTVAAPERDAGGLRRRLLRRRRLSQLRRLLARRCRRHVDPHGDGGRLAPRGSRSRPARTPTRPSTTSSRPPPRPTRSSTAATPTPTRASTATTTRPSESASFTVEVARKITYPSSGFVIKGKVTPELRQEEDRHQGLEEAEQGLQVLQDDQDHLGRQVQDHAAPPRRHLVLELRRQGRRPLPRQRLRLEDLRRLT